MIKFGPGGNSDSFIKEGYKSSLDVPAWLSAKGLNAFEYECTRGVKISEAMAKTFAKQAERYDISLSIHAPYYINLASQEEKIQQSSIGHILQTLRAADWMGATTVVIHPGTAGKIAREDALNSAIILLTKVVELMHEKDYTHISLCPETMGKNNQLGTVDEIIKLCKIAPEIIKPTIDFGHLHALTQGGMDKAINFKRVIDKIALQLGSKIARNVHVHFSPVEYTKGGEKKHHTLANKEFGPDFGYFAEVIVQDNLTPTIICESAGTQAEDAQTFMNIFRSYGGVI